MTQRKTPQKKPITVTAKKHLGQNFLIDTDIQDRIITACELTPQDNILEIGPGTGALTKKIVGQVQHLYAVEKDHQLAETLRKELSMYNLSIVKDDILTIDLKKFPRKIKVIGNIPYNLSTPIIERLIEHRHLASRLFLTVQLEFGQRLNAKPNSKAYGSLSCFVQYFYTVDLLFKIPSRAFRPMPKVTSCLLRLTPREITPPAKDQKNLFHIIRTAFRSRRKKAINNLAELIKKPSLEKVFSGLKLSTTLRAENIALTDYIKISDMISSKQREDGPLHTHYS